MDIHIKPINTFAHAEMDALYTMIFHFYEEYDPTHVITKESINDTIIHLTNHPESGSIQFVYDAENALVGYVILIKYWSNEYQGYLLFIDELYIVPDKRSLGYGRTCITLIEKTFHDIQALALEVSPKNTRAQAFYLQLGFLPNKNKTFIKIKY
ncbi:GNAT family N-acetyltransferase [Cytophaga hutchinsonii]|jgi:ribosomal protein S18 acetylase RimI-like enzyme|uniref:Histone acetyltransferase n=1 Tax=Cytophaga hutchinsonii (strain ATCC 33406 / DSM 1761 / CIP 103989 / NBRC 15051 / NCIMB 9469 / D465) TaxID=269798 RepID=A0A6N4SQ87_CYTH3|nr:GNAT family N-acetyltransferase [Cytophaga hutchinsonii]ABG58429.1 histone acetyltransferase [Cytophaga hutchinsonii ATCC 33406]SFX50367.1 Acetyltransferase (GNAT) family protein [Cytophaga hutchinsonii ATCC 33406]